jgi:dTDP-4-amino-4,6-dideoxygalactose transaminase
MSDPGPTESQPIPLFSLRFDGSDREAADAVLESGWITAGARVAEFETEFGRALGTDQVVALSSCTAALHLALAIYDVGPGDEVIIPALTFVAAANMVVARGAVPVFADVVSLEEPNIDPHSLERVLTERTRAVIPVHYAGYPCRMDELRDVAEGAGMVVIEDSAHACITRTEAGACGTLSDAGAFSFFSNKNLAIGEGGALVVRDEDRANRARLLRSHGMTTQTLDRHRGHAYSYDVSEAGFNYRWDELRAAVGTQRLSRLPDALERRSALAREYRTQLNEAAPGVTVPFGSDTESVPAHIFPILLPPGSSRDSIMGRMREQGIQTSIHYPLIPAFEGYRLDPVGEWGIAAEYCERVVTLPFYPEMTDDDVSRVAMELGRCLR